MGRKIADISRKASLRQTLCMTRCLYTTTIVDCLHATSSLSYLEILAAKPPITDYKTNIESFITSVAAVLECSLASYVFLVHVNVFVEQDTTSFKLKKLRCLCFSFYCHYRLEIKLSYGIFRQNKHIRNLS